MPNMIVTIVIFIVLIILYFLFSLWMNHRKVKNNHICLIVTKTRELVVGLYPKAGGNIKAPPNKLFGKEDDKERTYFYNRKFSLHTRYPLLASGLSAITQVDAYASIYEEGDPAPILPSDAEPIQTPERVKALTGQQIIPQVLGGLKDQFGQGVGVGLNFGKNKTLILIMIAVIVFAILISAWASIQVLQFIPYAQQWMSIR